MSDTLVFLDSINRSSAGQNVVPVHISAVTYNAVLTPGRYNIGTLTSDLQTAINHAVASTGVVFAVTVNMATFRVTISATSAFSLIGGYSTQHAVGTLYQYSRDEP